MGFFSKLRGGGHGSDDDSPSHQNPDRKPINVNDYEWHGEEAASLEHKGSLFIIVGIMTVSEGIKDANNRQKATVALERGIPLLEKAVRLERPPIPLPYKYLAEAYSWLAWCRSYGHDGTPDDATVLYRRATELAETALRYYDLTTGWDEGSRHDLHCALAFAHFGLYEVSEARSQLKQARVFRRDCSMMGYWADLLEDSVKKCGY